MMLSGLSPDNCHMGLVFQPFFREDLQPLPLSADLFKVDGLQHLQEHEDKDDKDNGLDSKHSNLCSAHIERYQNKVANQGHALLSRFDRDFPHEDVCRNLEKANEEIAAMVKEATQDTLSKVLYETSCKMKNSFSRSDA